MTNVKNFETKVYSDDAGWKIWLCTEVSNHQVVSFFKAQYPVKGSPMLAPKLLPISGYYDMVELVTGKLRHGVAWPNIPGGVEYCVQTKFVNIIMDAINSGSMTDVINAHGDKTRHIPEFLLGYKKPADGQHNLTVFHDADMGVLASVSFIETEEGYNVYTKMLATVRGAGVKVAVTNKGPIRSADGLNNLLLGHCQELLINAFPDVEERKDVIAEINSYFSGGRVGIETLLNQLNKGK